MIATANVNLLPQSLARPCRDSTLLPPPSHSTATASSLLRCPSLGQTNCASRHLGADTCPTLYYPPDILILRHLVHMYNLATAAFSLLPYQAHITLLPHR